MLKPAAPQPVVALLRNARLFMQRPHLLVDLERERRRVSLAPQQMVELSAPGDWVLRSGRLRLSEFLDDGRELTRSVLQAGSCFVTRAESPAAGRENWLWQDSVALMALGESELWRLDPGTLNPLLFSD